VKNIDCTI